MKDVIIVKIKVYVTLTVLAIMFRGGFLLPKMFKNDKQYNARQSNAQKIKDGATNPDRDELQNGK